MLDSSEPRAHDGAEVRRLLALLLALGAIIGLFGQGLAFAAGPAWEGAAAMSAPAHEPCADMTKEKPANAPCDGVTLDCIAAMGCIVPLLPIDAPRLEKTFVAAGPRLTEISPGRLTGRSPPPEPEPPTRLI